MVVRLFVAFVVACLPLTLSAQSTKRGTAGNSALIANSLNSRWHYRWHYLEPEGVYHDSQWAPMLFGAGTTSVLNNRIDYLLDRSDKFTHVLGFNEPERVDQGNTSVDAAIEAWQIIDNRFSAATHQLVSPAVSDNVEGRQWLSEFMQRADDNNLRVDAVAFHWYGTVNPNNPIASANNFLARVDDYYATYNRPIWITEFAGHDWNDQYSDAVMRQANAEFLAHAIPGLEARSHVQRYAWFQSGTQSTSPWVEGLLNEQDAYGLMRPTIVGKAYMPDQVLLTGESLELDGQSRGRDYYYLQGGSVTNTGQPLVDESIGGLYVMANEDQSLLASTLTGTSDWGLATGGFVRVEENATLRKQGNNTITWNDAELYIDGLVRLFGGAGNEGTLWIGSASTAVGTGQIRLDAGSHLRLGRTSNSAGFELPYDMQLRGGRMTSEGIGVRLTGDLTLFETTDISVSNANDTLEFAGSFLANPSGRTTGIRKSGSGLLSLNGNNEFTGTVRVIEGNLAINAITIAGQVLVDADGTLQGNGDAQAVVNVFGTVTPGNSVGTLTADAINFFDGSTLEMEIDSLTDFDQLIIDGQFLVETGATLRIVLGNGYAPEIGDQFQLFSAGSFSGEFGIIDAPELAAGRWDFSRLNVDGIAFVAVPEPNTLAVFGVAGLMFLVNRRRISSI